MPINNGKYINPNWNNGSPPAIDATELNAMSNTLQNLDNEAKQVGDIVLTTRTDLGSNYLLCNGDVVTSSMYPTLYPKLQKNGPDANFRRVVSPVAPFNNGSSVMYFNGYYISIPVRTNSDTTKLEIKYRTLSSNTWNTKTISPRVSGNSFYGRIDFKYINGNYCILVTEFKTTSTDVYGSIYYFTSLTNSTYSYVNVLTLYNYPNLRALRMSYTNNRICTTFEIGASAGRIVIPTTTSFPPTTNTVYNTSYFPCGEVGYNGSTYFVGTSDGVHYLNGSTFTRNAYIDCDLGMTYYNGKYYSFSINKFGSSSVTYGYCQLTVHPTLTGNVNDANVVTYKINDFGVTTDKERYMSFPFVWNGYLVFPLNTYDYNSNYGTTPISFSLIYFTDITKNMFVNTSSSFEIANYIYVSDMCICISENDDNYNPKYGTYDMIIFGEKSLPEVDGGALYPMIKAN